MEHDLQHVELTFRHLPKLQSLSILNDTLDISTAIVYRNNCLDFLKQSIALRQVIFKKIEERICCMCVCVCECLAAWFSPATACGFQGS